MIRTYNKNIINVHGSVVKKHSEIINASQFAIKKLMPRLRSLYIDVELLKIKEEDIYGYCNWIDCNIRPRMFDIEIDFNQNDKNIILTLFHEMVHVKQYVKGELKDRLNVHLWKGERISGDYEVWGPWEDEAEELSEELYKEFTL